MGRVRTLNVRVLCWDRAMLPSSAIWWGPEVGQTGAGKRELAVFLAEVGRFGLDSRNTSAPLANEDM